MKMIKKIISPKIVIIEYKIKARRKQNKEKMAVIQKSKIKYPVLIVLKKI